MPNNFNFPLSLQRIFKNTVVKAQFYIRHIEKLKHREDKEFLKSKLMIRMVRTRILGQDNSNCTAPPLHINR